MKQDSLMQEDILIRKEQDRSHHLIRQERYEEGVENCTITINEDKFQVLNYSYFGVAFNGPRQFDIGSVISHLNFICSEINFGSYEAVVRRSEKSSANENTFNTAVEFTTSIFPASSVLGHLESQKIIKAHEERIVKFRSLREDFRMAVYEVKDFLTSLQKEMDQYEKNQFFYNNHEKEIFESHTVKNIQSHLENFFSSFYDKAASFLAEFSKEEIEKYYDFFRSELGSILYLSPFSNRSYYKPMGYAGDFEMMNILYRNELVGESVFAKGLHQYFVNHPNAKAVRNRSHYLFSFLKKEIQLRESQERIKILSVASGPAKEMQMILENFDQNLLERIEFHLLDQDLFSLKYAQRQINQILKANKINANFHYHNKAIKNIITEGIPEKYDIVYSAGLFDYFTDKVAFMAANQLHQSIENNGVLNIGNFCFQASSAALMAFALDWQLIYRSPERLKQIYCEISSDVNIESEEEGVNLFAVIRK